MLKYVGMSTYLTLSAHLPTYFSIYARKKIYMFLIINRKISGQVGRNEIFTNIFYFLIS